MSKRGLWIYGAWTTGMTALYLSLPEFGLVVVLAIMLTTATAVVVGIRRNRPRRWLPWALIGAATFAFGTASITAVIVSEVLHKNAFPSLADGIYLGGFMPLLFLGLLSLTRSGAAVRLAGKSWGHQGEAARTARPARLAAGQARPRPAHHRGPDRAQRPDVHAPAVQPRL